jgi:hypothetical protein
MPMPTIKTTTSCANFMLHLLCEISVARSVQNSARGVSTCGTETDTKNSGVNKFYFVAVNNLRIYSVAL